VTKKTLYGITLPLMGVLGGVIGAAFALGASKQHVQDTLIKHGTAIQKIEKSIDRGTLRHIEIITSISRLGAEIRILTKAVEHLEEDLD
jgi:hypothetical protein